MREVKINALSLADPRKETEEMREARAEIHKGEEIEAEKLWKETTLKKIAEKPRRGLYAARKSRHEALVENIFLDKDLRPAKRICPGNDNAIPRAKENKEPNVISTKKLTGITKKKKVLPTSLKEYLRSIRTERLNWPVKQLAFQTGQPLTKETTVNWIR